MTGPTTGFVHLLEQRKVCESYWSTNGIIQGNCFYSQDSSRTFVTTRKPSEVDNRLKIGRVWVKDRVPDEVTRYSMEERITNNVGLRPQFPCPL